MLFDEYFGINKAALQFMENINENNAVNFVKQYVTFDDNDFENFSKMPSLRIFESSRNELNALKTYWNIPFTPVKYDIAVLSDCDKIFDIKKQKEYYQDNYIEIKNAAHNIFSKFESFDVLIDIS